MILAKGLSNSKKSRLNVRSLTVLALLLLCSISGISQTIKLKKPADTTPVIQQINDASGNGIIVTEPKIYDDSALVLMLNAARLKLATLQAFDQTGLTSRIGALTGATLNQQSISGQILGPPIPQAVTTSLGATGSTQTVNTAGNTGSTQTTTAPTATTTVQTNGNTGGQTVTTNAGLPVENVTTTIAPQSAAVPTGPQLSAALPTSGFNISSLSALNEMMQLSYEITNLQLLLEGSLTDRYIEGTHDIKPRTTLGFSITIQNPEEYRDAVAILEVEVSNPATVKGNEAPAVTAILPREKTYNVANISDKMLSFGGGVLTQVINGGFSFMRGRKNYFIVQDQDTLAMMRESLVDKSTVFSWQFRPVLGQRVVTAGLKQTFVQLAMPIEADQECFGSLKIKTYWRRLDRKKNLLGEVIPDTIRTNDLDPISVSRIDTTPIPSLVNYNDLGSGIVLASVKGQFLPGTYVRVGGNFYREGSPGFTFELSRIRFIANAADVAQFGAYLVSRDGRETEIADSRDPNPVQNFVNPCKAVVADTGGAAKESVPNVSITTATYDGANSVVTATFKSRPKSPNDLKEYLVFMGGKVYGLSDAPLEYSLNSNHQEVIKLIVPTKTLLSAKSIEVKPLFWRSGFSKNSIASLFKAGSAMEKAVQYRKEGNGDITFLLYGNNLKDVAITTADNTVIPSTPLEQNSTEDTLRLFRLTMGQTLGKQITIKKHGDEAPILVNLPTPVPALKFDGDVTIGSDEMSVEGEELDKLKSVTCSACGGDAIVTKLSSDKKRLTLSNLIKAKVSSSTGTKVLEFEWDFGAKNNLQFKVVK